VRVISRRMRKPHITSEQIRTMADHQAPPSPSPSRSPSTNPPPTPNSQRTRRPSLMQRIGGSARNLTENEKASPSPFGARRPSLFARGTKSGQRPSLLDNDGSGFIGSTVSAPPLAAARRPSSISMDAIRNATQQASSSFEDRVARKEAYLARRHGRSATTLTLLRQLADMESEQRRASSMRELEVHADLLNESEDDDEEEHIDTASTSLKQQTGASTEATAEDDAANNGGADANAVLTEQEILLRKEKKKLKKEKKLKKLEKREKREKKKSAQSLLLDGEASFVSIQEETESSLTHGEASFSSIQEETKSSLAHGETSFSGNSSSEMFFI
jgi:hypothetical protein